MLPVEHDIPVIDKVTGKQSEIYLLSYRNIPHHLLDVRRETESRFIGRCKEAPIDVFEALFRRYPITRFNCVQLYDTIKFGEAPMVGLGIEPTLDSDIGNTISEILKEPILSTLNRKKSLPDDVRIIIGNLTQPNMLGRQDYQQKEYDKGQIISVLSQYNL